MKDNRENPTNPWAFDNVSFKENAIYLQVPRLSSQIDFENEEKCGFIMHTKAYTTAFIKYSEDKKHFSIISKTNNISLISLR